MPITTSRRSLEIRAARPDEVDPALALVASYADASPGAAVAALREAARRGEIDLNELTVAVAGDRLLGAILAILTPGRTGFVTTPGVGRRESEREVAVALLSHWRLEAAARGLAMIQAFLPVTTGRRSLSMTTGRQVSRGDRRWQGYLEEAGFAFLADLIYLERASASRAGEARQSAGRRKGAFTAEDAETAERQQSIQGAPSSALSAISAANLLSWRTYSPETHSTFARVITETYRRTLDCPQLEGLRSIEDTIAGHKAQGRFDPRRWFLLERGGAPADDQDEAMPLGCVLLNEIPERDSLDITYMGLVPEARGQGFGAALVQQAIDETRRAGRSRLTCAVDANNLPAIKTYARFDFRSLDTRRVFIAVPQRPTAGRQDVP